YNRWKQHCYCTNSFITNTSNYTTQSNYLYRFLFNFNILRFMILPLYSTALEKQTDSDRKLLEKFLIKHYSPPLNTVCNRYNNNGPKPITSQHKYRTRKPKWLRDKIKKLYNIPGN